MTVEKPTVGTNVEFGVIGKVEVVSSEEEKTAGDTVEMMVLLVSVATTGRLVGAMEEVTFREVKEGCSKTEVLEVVEPTEETVVELATIKEEETGTEITSVVIGEMEDMSNVKLEIEDSGVASTASNEEREGDGEEDSGTETAEVTFEK